MLLIPRWDTETGKQRERKKVHAQHEWLNFNVNGAENLDIYRGDENDYVCLCTV